MKSFQPWLILLLIAGAILAGCSTRRYQTAHGQYLYKRSTDEYLSDKMIHARVKHALLADPYVKGTDIQVTTRRRLVQLSGFVDTEQQRQRAEELTRQSQGVAAILNSILLKGEIPLVKLAQKRATPELPLEPTGSPAQSRNHPEPLDPPRATEPLTGLSLIRHGNRYIAEESQNKVVQLRSEKSRQTLHPSTWFVVYHDTTAAQKTTEVKFENGKMVDVNRPLRVLEPVSDRPDVFDVSQLKIDSNEALHLALNEENVENAQISSAAFRLEPFEGVPTWKIRFWGGEGENERDLGEVFISAENGELLQRKLVFPKTSASQKTE